MSHIAESGLLTERDREALMPFGSGVNLYPKTLLMIEAIVARRMAQAWDEREKAKPQYLGPHDGHYDDCCGWEDCHCASYPNPYRVTPPGKETASE